ncbi:MAG: dihydrodipicolinate synthase family protein [Cycloclasticus sp.]|nr:dihydrodipicolinate synthase family protein [Cycloclasticus sp.]MDF1688804.1 dihydrodipicolinate synthase family protein [Cycloclasticus sp.]MEE4290169.1 dihydrodipicolinate synthase family protein [Cycloclasticus sp.]
MSTRQHRLTVDDVNGAWAIIPTPAITTAEDWRTEDSVDYDEVAKAVEGLISSGVDAIMSQGTFGEGATLTWEEKKKMMEVMVETAAGRVPIFVGVTTMNTRETIHQLKFARDIGADGAMVGLPMWQQIDVPGAVRFYKDITDAVPEMAICVYANPEAFKFDFPTPFWAQVADIPQIITCKYINIAQLHVHTLVSRKKIRFLALETDHADAAKMDPDFHTAFWTPLACTGPELTIYWRDSIKEAVKTGDWSIPDAIYPQIMQTLAHIFPPGGFSEFSRYNIQLDKARINAAGWMKAGPCRPPYISAPENYIEGAIKAGKGWAELNKKLIETGSL